MLNPKSHIPKSQILNPSIHPPLILIHNTPILILNTPVLILSTPILIHPQMLNSPLYYACILFFTIFDFQSLL